MEQTTEKFDAFALVEIMGHTKVAGKARTVTFGSTVMLQVDIPETTSQPAFSKMYGMSSIFSITPVTEELAQMHAEAYKVHPINEYAVQIALEKKMQAEVTRRVDNRLKELQAHNPDEEVDDIEKQKAYRDKILERLEQKGYDQIELDGDEISSYYFDGMPPTRVADILINRYAFDN